MNFRQFLKDIHATFFFYFLQAMKQSQKKLQKNHKMEKMVSITWDLLLLFQKIKQLNLYLLPDDFSNSIQEYILPAVFIILWKPKSETEKMNVFEFSNTMFVTYLFDWAERQGVFREKNMAYFFSKPTISIGTYCVIRYNSSTPFDAVKCSTFIDPSHLWNNYL